MRLQVIPAMSLVVKTIGRPEAVISDLRRTMHELDPSLPFRTPKSMKMIIAGSLTFERLDNWLFGSFAVIAVLLATLGLYGLISHEVALSTRDIGVRVALGATRARVLALVLCPRSSVR
jgi:ABC-type antimicrobial peptide transport system permease subunit